jgi:hypothetical protein
MAPVARALAWLRAQPFHHLLHVAPDLPFQCRVFQQCLRVQARHEGRGSQVVKGSPQGADSRAAFQQQLCRRFSKGHDHLGSNGADTAHQFLAAGAGSS